MKEQIQNDLKQAMRDKDAVKLNVLRQLKSAMSNASLQKGNIDSEVSGLEVLNIIRKEISKRNDSIASFTGRDDLIVKEQAEIDVLTAYLPEDLSDQELEEIVNTKISELGATTKRDMGNVIKAVVSVVAGRADNKKISKLVGDRL